MRDLLPLVLVVLSCIPASADDASPISVLRIESSRLTFGTTKSQLVIERKGTGYVSQGKPVATTLVEQFAAALARPVAPGPTLTALGVTSEWLAANAEAAFADHPPAVAVAQRDLFLQTFRDPDVAGRLLARHIDGRRRTDDFPKVTLKVRRVDGSEVLVESLAQPAFMVPWTITRGGESVRTYDAAIPRALAALLPPDFANRGRLAGESLRWELTSAVREHIRERWDVLGVEARLGSQLGAVSAIYEISGSRIDTLYTHDVDGDERWHARLRRREWPERVRASVSLSLDHDRVFGIETLSARVDQAVARVLAAPWFVTDVAARPDAEVDVRIVDDRSLSPRAIASMKENAAVAPALQRVEADAAAMVYVEVHEERPRWSNWVFLPDGTALLWEFFGDRVLHWPAADVGGSKCYDNTCVYRLVSAQGVLQPPSP